MLQINDFIEFQIYGLSAWRLTLAGFVFIGVMFARKVFDLYVVSALRKITKKTRMSYDDQILTALSRPVSYLFFFAGFYLALRIIDLQHKGGIDFNTFFSQTYKVLSATLLVWAIYRLTDVLSNIISDRLSKSDDALKHQFVPLFRSSLRVFVVSVGALLIIQNLGYSVSSLLAGLGIGGLAVALAAQETLANFFASVLLLTDMPFRMGDWIRFSDVEGVVESVGFRTTRIRTFEKSLITVPNKILTGGPIENYTMRERRRIYSNLSIAYDTPAEKVELFVKEIRAILEAHEMIHNDFYLVYFDKYLDSALNIMVYCFTKTIVWEDYLRIRQELNLKLLRLAERLDVEYAFPSQTVYWGRSSEPVQISAKVNRMNGSL